MANASVVFCGLARDVAEGLPSTIARAERTGGMFADYRVVIYENDSGDDTPHILRVWQTANPKVITLCETRGLPRWPSVCDPERLIQMAACRNRYHEVIVEDFRHFDFVIVLDCDLLGWSYDGLANTFGHRDWDVMAAAGMSWWHGRPIFYDRFAFRPLGDSQPHLPKAEVKAMSFPRGTPPIRVSSCFNGLGVYRMPAFAAGRYSGEDCEHVVFHRHLAAAGFDRIFLNPSLVTLYPDFAILRPQSTSHPWWRPAA